MPEAPSLLKSRMVSIPQDGPMFRSLHTANRQSRGAISFRIDYATAEYSGNNDVFFYMLPWAVNKAFESGPPANESGNFTCKWVAVLFDSLYDNYGQTGFPYAGTDVVIDRINLWLNHKNLSGQNDSLRVSVLAKANTTSGLSTNNNGITLTNTVLWDTLLVTNTSLTSVPSTMMDVLQVPCGKYYLQDSGFW